ncbi:MAG TPA: hypothetical protein VF120_18230 [Ktedonobacterales bacterium]
MFRDPQQLARLTQDHRNQLQHDADVGRTTRHPSRDLGAQRGSRHARIRREQDQATGQR